MTHQEIYKVTNVHVLGIISKNVTLCWETKSYRPILIIGVFLWPCGFSG